MVRTVWLEKLMDPQVGDYLPFLLQYSNGDEETRRFTFHSNRRWESAPYDSNETRTLVAVNGRSVSERGPWWNIQC